MVTGIRMLIVLKDEESCMSMEVLAVDNGRIMNRPAGNGQLSIFVSEADRTGMDIRAMSDFLANRISSLSLELIDSARLSTSSVKPADIALIDQALKVGKPVVQGEFEYVLDFDSLPSDILKKYREGKYKLGNSHQVEDNLRAVIVDEKGTRVKDLTLKRERRTVSNADSLQSIAIQAQLRQMDAKLDTILELQGYQIDFARNNALVRPFFDARDQIVHAQNELDVERRRTYLDTSVSLIEQAMNAAYIDIENIQKRLLRLTRWPYPFRNGVVNQYIGYITQDLQLIVRYNGILLQVLDYLGKKQDMIDAFEKYRSYMLGFYTKAVGAKQIPLSLHIHNVFEAVDKQNRNIWKEITDEMVPVLQNKSEIQEALIISVGDDTDEEERK